MMLSLLFAFLPSFIGVPLRRAFGAKIGRGARIGFGTILRADRIEIGEGARIGPFAVIRAHAFVAGPHTQVKPLSLLKASEIRLGSYVHIAPTAVVSGDLTPKCRIEVGDHSRIFPFCWIEPGEGITLGKHVGVGGHCLIFTHGAWSDYLAGGPISYGPVVIEDRVWLPWRVFVLANVTIGHDAIIGAGAVVNKNVPAGALAAGMPAKVVAESVIAPLTPEQRTERARTILGAFAATGVSMNGQTIVLDDEAMCKRGDLLFLVNRAVGEPERARLLGEGISILDHAAGTLTVAAQHAYLEDFLAFVRRYGIRLARQKANGEIRSADAAPSAQHVSA